MKSRFFRRSFLLTAITMGIFCVPDAQSANEAGIAAQALNVVLNEFVDRTVAITDKNVNIKEDKVAGKSQPAFNKVLIAQAETSAMPSQTTQELTKTARSREEKESRGTIEEVMVTARRREESLQDIPDAVTVFSAIELEKARVNNFADISLMTPNMLFRESFNDGVNFTTMRGITTPQQGLPPVTYVFDGVQAASTQFINLSLFDIERIEVLRGPQGALYGAGAMAGAINIITKKPDNNFSGRVTAGIGDGPDMYLQGAVSGPIVQDKLFYRVSGEFRNSDGVVENNRGEKVDFDDHGVFRGRLLWDGEDLTIDARISWADYDKGAATQELYVTGPDGLPVIGADRAINDSRNIESDIIGNQQRSLFDASLKIDYDSDHFTFTSISAYADSDTDTFGDLDFTDTDAFGACFFFPDTNCTGIAQIIIDNYDFWSQEIKLTSPTDQRLRWLVGSWYQEREAVTVISVPVAFNTDEIEPFVDIFGLLIGGFPRTDLKNDELFAVFGQVNYDLTDKLELTVGARYDEAKYDTTGFNCLECTDRDNLIQSTDPTGLLVDTLTAEDDNIQLKVSISYDWTDSLMTYFTYSEGYRPGFFTTGNRAAAEDTKNFEIGFKSSWMRNTFVFNGAFFSIDYSNQQFSQVINTPPFRIVTNIPESDIKGLELEAFVKPLDGLDVSVGFGWIDAQEATGFDAPFVPEYTFNTRVGYMRPLRDTNLDVTGQVEFRRTGSYFLARQEVFEVDPIDILNLRLSVSSPSWRVSAYVENTLDNRQPSEFIPFLTGIVKSWSMARQFGVEVTFRH